MIDERQVQEILAQYQRHGWNLRRVLLSPATMAKLSFADLFGQATVIATDFDAAWFSRGAADGGEAWELRTLSAAPFALIEVFEDTDDEVVREEIRHEMETQMRERASKPVGRKPTD